MLRALNVVGWVLSVLSVALILGNITGVFTTFPFAGALTGVVASSLLGWARGTQAPAPPPSATETRGYSVITIAFVGALMTLSWLVLGESLYLGDTPIKPLAIVFGVTLLFSALFVTLLSKAIAARRRA